ETREKRESCYLSLHAEALRQVEEYLKLHGFAVVSSSPMRWVLTTGIVENDLNGMETLQHEAVLKVQKENKFAEVILRTSVFIHVLTISQRVQKDEVLDELKNVISPGKKVRRFEKSLFSDLNATVINPLSGRAIIPDLRLRIFPREKTAKEGIANDTDLATREWTLRTTRLACTHQFAPVEVPIE
ncbi:MAG: hypothetical protein AB1540_14465, partial [Bdellovibrionota bacterium]